MAISDKLTYLNTTKSQLKDQINYGLPTEKQITSSTTFREYVGSIFEAFLEALRNPDTLFTNLPKTSASGSQITLNGTANAPMRITLNPTAISQTTYTGKNLLGLLFTTTPTQVGGVGFSYTNNSFTLSGTATGTWATFTLDYNINIVSGNTYYFSANVTGTNPKMQIKVRAYDGNTELFSIAINQGNNYENSVVANFSATINKCTFTIESLSNGEAYNLTATNIQLEKSSSKTSFEPYVGGTASPNPSYPQDIHTISGNNSVVVEGKNLFTISGYQKSGWNITIDNPLKGMSAGNYTLSCVNSYPTSGKGIAVNFANTPFGDRIGTYFTGYDFGNTRFSYSQTLSNEQVNANYMVLQPQDNTCTQETLENMKIMIELGSTATTYTPYVSQTTPINLGEYELGTIGNYSNEFVRQ